MSVVPQAAESRPKVSVCMMTYNHEKYIGQAIDSVLMQETEYPYELVIGEDSSRDGTRDIALRYERERPGVVRVLCHDKNLGMLRNLASALEGCRGEYIALLDGDDYWTSRRKMQRQVDLLDQHPETVLCFHQAIWSYEDGSREPSVFPERSGAFFALEDLLREHYCFIPTCSAMFRRAALEALPDWYFELQVGDWPLHILIARKGNIAFIAEPMGVYRIHPGNTWSSREESERLAGVADMLRRVEGALEGRYRSILRDTMFKVYLWLGLDAVAAGDRSEARRWARACFTVLPPARRLRDKLHLGLQAYAPGAYARMRALKRWATGVKS